MKRKLWSATLAALLMSISPPGPCRGSENVDLEDFSLEELLDVEIVSVSKKSESAFGAPAAVYVITAEDIRRSGATTVPEALRLAPGVHAAQIDAARWAVTARGFNNRFANKLQVLVDGRSIYSPMFSGTYWEAPEVALEDIERIEVIRGPGATLWGANAVNGVINIITHAPDPADGLVAGAWGGTEDLARARVSASGRTGDYGSFRLTATARHFGATEDVTGAETPDAAREKLATGRWDLDLGSRDHLRVGGHVLDFDQDVVVSVPIPTPPYAHVDSAAVPTRIHGIDVSWRHDLSETSGIELSASHSWFERVETVLTEDHEVSDADLQHDFLVGNQHAVIWGAGLRRYHDDMDAQLGIGFDPASRTDWTRHAFIQDEVTAVPDRLRLTLGVKVEGRNDISPQWQPNGRFAWTPDERQTIWGSIAEAARTPARTDRHLFLDISVLPPGATPLNPDNAVITTLVGNEDFEPERLRAYELGYRVRPTDHTLFDVTAFRNEYDHLQTVTTGAMRVHPIYGPPVLQIPLVMINGMAGHTRGVEAAVTVSGDIYQVQFSYGHIDFQLDETLSPEELEIQNLGVPRHLWSAHVSLNPGGPLEADLVVRHQSPFRLGEYDRPALDELDARLGWHPGGSWSLSIGGRNLIPADDPEYIENTETVYDNRIPRVFLATAELRF